MVAIPLSLVKQISGIRRAGLKFTGVAGSEKLARQQF